MKRKPGRPAAEPTDLVTVDEALAIIREELAKKYSPELAKKLCLAKGTLRNKMCKNEIRRWHKGKYALLSRAEVIEKLVS